MKEINHIAQLAMLGFKWVKNNLSIVIILPALLGGIWQLIELSSISFSFIRFFSVSQVIPDGLLILLILLMFTISSSFLYWVYYYTILHDPETGDTGNISAVNETVPKKSNIIVSVILMALYLAILVFYVWSIDHFLNELDSLFTLIILFPVGMILIYLAMAFYIYSNLNCLESIFLSKLFRATVWLMPMTIFISVLMFVTQFHNFFLMPDELINVRIVKHKIEKENPSVNTEIIYANDKYIFVELDGFMQLNNKPVRKLIRVIKFDELLDINNVKGYSLPKDF